MRKKSDLFSLLLEFSHFQGTLPQLFSQLKTQLLLIFGRSKAHLFVLPSTPSKSFDFSSFEHYFSQTDNLSPLFPIAEFPSKIKDLLEIKSHHLWAIPLRHADSPRTISAFLLLPDSPPEVLQFFQTLASMTAHKITLLELRNKNDAFLKHYHLGLLCPELFHEIKNKLIAPKTFLQSFPKKFQDPKFRDEFSKIAVDEIEHIQKRLEQALNFSASSMMDDSRSSITLPQIVEQCLAILDVEIQKHDIHVRMDFKTAFSFKTPVAQTREIIFNLLLNGIQAMKETRGKRILSVFTQKNENQSQFTVLDSGTGISNENLRHAFQPYFTTKSGGSGLGLSTSKRWIENAGGQIVLHSEKNKGTRVTLCF